MTEDNENETPSDEAVDPADETVGSGLNQDDGKLKEEEKDSGGRAFGR